MLTAKYKDMRIVVSKSAMRELIKYEKTLYDVIEVLEEGYDAPRARAKGTVEKWLNKGSKTFNAVVVREWHEMLKEECWVLIHFGKFSHIKNNAKNSAKGLRK